MPFCPVCKLEYRPGFTLCSDCEVELVEKLPETAQNESLTEAGTLSDPAFGDMICEIMDNEGIQCALSGEGKDEMLPGGAGPTRSVKVMVPQKDLARAKELLHAYFEEEYFSDEAEFLTCSSCGCAVNEEDSICPACSEPLEDEH